MNTPTQMRTKLGRTDIELPRVGLGCMGMSDAYGTPDKAEAIRTIHRAIEIGVDHFDTADVYGLGSNEELLREALAGKRDRATIATKCGLVRDDVGAWIGVSGRPAYIREKCEASLARLGVDVIDLYYLHRADTDVPIEDSVGALASLVEAGKVRAIGLSEVSTQTLERAHAVHPVSAVQSELSLWTRDLEDTVLKACKRLGVTFVAYSPLGRGMLTATVRTKDDMPAGDYRHTTPRFQGEAFEKNLKLADELAAIASAKGCTPAQLALAWAVRLGDAPTDAGCPSIMAIPGTKRVKYLEDNAAAARIELSADEHARLDELFPKDGAADGERYPPHRIGELNR